MDLFALKNIINESASIAALGIQKTEFLGELEDAFEHANLIVNESAHEVFVNGVMTKEVLLEAATLADESSYEVLNENIFKAAWAKIVGFYKTVKSVVSGIIDKIKAGMSSMAGDTEKWLKVMKKPVNDNIKNASKFVYTGIPYVKTAISLTDFKESAGAVTSLKEAAEDSKELAGQVKMIGEAIKNKKYHEALKTVEDYKLPLQDVDTDKLIKADKEDYFKTFSGAKSVEEILKALRESVHGKNAQEIEITGFSKISADDMLSTIEKSKDFLTGMKEAYEKFDDDITSVLNMLSDSQSTVDIEITYDGVTGDQKEKLSELKAALPHLFAVKIAKTKLVQSTVQSIFAESKRLHQAQVKDFMNILSKFARFKPKKD